MKVHAKKFQRVFLLLAIVLVMAIFQGRAFFTFFNMMNILLSISIYGIMICGSIFPLLIGGMDLSIGSVAAFSGALAAILISTGGYTGASVFWGILAGLGVGAAAGLVNGLITYLFNVPALLVTISTQYIMSGLVQRLTENRGISCNHSVFFSFLGGGVVGRIPFPIFIMLAMALVVYFVLKKTVLGRQVYAVGGNAVATKLMGASPFKITVFAYVISGLTAALAGIVLVSMNQMAKASTASGYELYVFIAMVVGGVSFAGGEGTVQGALFGALFVGVLTNALMLLGVDSTYHQLIEGVIIIAAVALNMRARMKGSGLQRGGFLARLKGTGKRARE